MKKDRAGSTIRISDKDAREKLAKMSQEDYRPYGSMLTVLILQEWERRHGTDVPCTPAAAGTISGLRYPEQKQENCEAQ